MARLFNGSSDYISSGPQIGPQQALTYCARINPSSTGTNFLIASIYNNDNNLGRVVGGHSQFGVLSGGFLFGQMLNTGGGTGVLRESNSGAIATNVLNHVAMRWDGGSSPTNIQLFLNGVQCDTASAGTSFSVSTDVIHFEIASQSFGQAPLTGIIEDVCVWDAALTNSEIMDLVRGANPLTIRKNGLWRYYPLDFNNRAINLAPRFQSNTWNGNLFGTTLTRIVCPRRPLVSAVKNFRFAFGSATAAALTSRLKAMVAWRGAEQGKTSLPARVTVMSTLHASPKGALPIVGRATVEAMARAQAAPRASLTSKSAIAAKLKAAASASTGLAGRVATLAQAKAAISVASALQALAGLGKAMVTARAAISGNTTLAGRAAVATFGKMIPPGAIALVARAAYALRARLGFQGVTTLQGMSVVAAHAAPAMSGSTGLSGRAKGAAQGRASVFAAAVLSGVASIQAATRGSPAARALLAGRMVAATTLRSALSAATNLISLSGSGKAAVAARASLVISGNIALAARATIASLARAALSAILGFFSPVQARTLGSTLRRRRTLEHMYTGIDFDNIDVGETITYFFDFTGQLAPAIGSVPAEIPVSVGNGGVWKCSVACDSLVNDPNAANIAVGAANINGNITGQRFANTVAGVKYLLQAFVTTSQGNNLELWSHIYCDMPK